LVLFARVMGLTMIAWQSSLSPIEKENHPYSCYWRKMDTTNTALRRVIMHEKQIKLIAYASIIALWLVWLADLAIDIRTMFDDGFWQALANLAPWRVEVATFALFLFPFVSGGVYVLNRGLRQPWLCLMLVFLFSTVCIYMHSSYFYFARAAAYHATLSGAEREAVGALLAEYQSFKNIFGAVFLIGVLVVSVWLFAVVAAGKTVFPRAFALLSPLTGVLLGRMLRVVYPSAAVEILIAALTFVLLDALMLSVLFDLF